MPNQENGFSLIELIIVIVLLGLLMAIAIPQMSGTLFNTTYRDAAQEVLQVLRQGRSLAVSSNLEQRAEFDLTNHRFRLAQGNRASSSSSWTTPPWTDLPVSVNLRGKLDCSDTNNIDFVFAPNGTAIIDPAVAPTTDAEVPTIGSICIVNENDLTDPAKFIVTAPHNCTNKDLPIVSSTGRAIIQ